MPTEIPLTGSWNLRDLKDTRENITDSIQRAQSVPAHAKAFLIAQVNLLPATAKLVRVDAHCHVVGDKFVLNAAIAPL